MKTISTFLLFAVLSCLNGAMNAARVPVCQDDARVPPAGEETQKWQGVLDVRVAQLTLNFEVSESDNGAWTGNIYSVEQGNAKIPISKMTVENNNVTIEASSVGASFTGTLAEDSQTITGEWKQGGASHDLTIRRVESFNPGEHIETWQGTLEAAGNKFDFGLRVFRAADGTWFARLDSYNEGAMGLHATMERGEKQFDFELKSVGAAFKGTISETGQSVEGTWTQGGGSFQLKFEKVALDAGQKINRPQHPVPPYPYAEMNVAFENPDDEVRLAGTLTLPRGDGPFPAMILISGSGPQDRDETLMSHKPFLVIADHLTRNGIAVLRFDDRGVGESTGDFAAATSEDLARDVAAAVNFLKARAEIRGDRIGLIGHSEGGVIAPMVAVRSPDVAMIVLLAGTGVNGATISISQSRAIAEAVGAPASVVDANERFLKQVLKRLDESDEPLDSDWVDEAVAEVISSLESQGQVKGDGSTILDAAKASVAAIESPWFRFFLRHDPAAVLRQVKCPVLALNGKKDLQVLADLNIDAIQAALKEGGNKDFEVHKLDNLNHLFQETDGAGAPLDYGRIEQTFSPVALGLMTEWIKKHAR